MPIVSNYQHQELPAWFAAQQQRLGEKAESNALGAYHPYNGKRMADFLNPDIINHITLHLSIYNKSEN